MLFNLNWFMKIKNRIVKHSLSFLVLTQLIVEKWGVWGSNSCPCINYAMSLPTELCSPGRKTFY